MKSIIISLHPEWAAMILSGRKTIEVRKTAPDPPFRAYIYCTQPTQKIIGEFTCNKVETYYNTEGKSNWGYSIKNSSLQKTGLTRRQFVDYGNGKDLKGMIISDTKIYMEPRKLSEFWADGFCVSRINCSQCRYYKDKKCTSPNKNRHPVFRAPQSWMHVEE